MNQIASSLRNGDDSERRAQQPKLGILDFNPIQYHAPLYQMLEHRGNIALNVLFLSEHGFREAIDPGFGVSVAWDIDLLSGYSYRFIDTEERRQKITLRIATLVRWLRSHDVVVVHGYSDPWMLLAILICRTYKVPYLMRGDSGPEGQSKGLRRKLRDLCASLVVAPSAGGLAVGRLNEMFYRKYHARRITFAPHSVDNARFARALQDTKSDLLARWGLNDRNPVILFCGKLNRQKRPLDLSEAVKLLPYDVSIMFVGDGVLAKEVRDSLKPGGGVVTGFVNQLELPVYYQAADILVLPSEVEPWGLVVNEAMAAGVLPVVSHRVGAAPDLVSGVGEIYKCGDITDLASAIQRALERSKEPSTHEQIRQRVAQYSLDMTAIGFEEAAFVATATRQD